MDTNSVPVVLCVQVVTLATSSRLVVKSLARGQRWVTQTISGFPWVGPGLHASYIRKLPKGNTANLGGAKAPVTTLSEKSCPAASRQSQHTSRSMRKAQCALREHAELVSPFAKSSKRRWTHAGAYTHPAGTGKTALRNVMDVKTK